MQRITQANLDAILLRINKMTNSPLESSSRDANGKWKANIGNYHFDHCYGGISLLRMVNEVGGCTDVFSHRFTKREMYYQLHAFISGIESRQQL